MSVGKESVNQPRQGVGLQGDLGLRQREQSKVTNHQKSWADELDPGCAEGLRMLTAVGVAVFAQGASEEVPCALAVQPGKGVASDGTRDWPWVCRFF